MTVNKIIQNVNVPIYNNNVKNYNLGTFNIFYNISYLFT